MSTIHKLYPALQKRLNEGRMTLFQELWEEQHSPDQQNKLIALVNRMYDAGEVDETKRQRGEL